MSEGQQPYGLLAILAGSSSHNNNTTLSQRFEVSQTYRLPTEPNTEFEKITLIWTSYNSIYTLQYLGIRRTIQYSEAMFQLRPAIVLVPLQ